MAAITVREQRQADATEDDGPAGLAAVHQRISQKADGRRR